MSFAVEENQTGDYEEEEGGERGSYRMSCHCAEEEGGERGSYRMSCHCAEEEGGERGSYRM
jgi:hypothetical protein